MSVLDSSMDHEAVSIWSFLLQVGFSLTYAEKLVLGKMSRGQYMDLEQATNAKKEDIFTKIELLLNVLWEREEADSLSPLFLPFICPDFVPIASLDSIARDNIEIIREDYSHSIFPSSSVLLYTLGINSLAIAVVFRDWPKWVYISLADLRFMYLRKNPN